MKNQGVMRTRKQREVHLAMLATWLGQRKTYDEIQAMMKEMYGYAPSKPQLTYDSKVLRRRWIEEQLLRTSEIVAREVAELEQVSREAWESWKKSKSDKVRNSAKRKTKGADGGSGEETTRTMVSETQVGNPVFLGIILNVQARRAALLGLDMPTKSEIAGPDGQPLALPEAEAAVIILPQKDFIDIQTVEGDQTNGNGNGQPQGGAGH